LKRLDRVVVCQTSDPNRSKPHRHLCGSHFCPPKCPIPAAPFVGSPLTRGALSFQKNRLGKVGRLRLALPREPAPLPRRAPHPLERNPGRDEAKPSLEKEIQLVRLEGSAVFAGLDQNQKKRHKI
jgi:hypothetical protein